MLTEQNKNAGGPSNTRKGDTGRSTGTTTKGTTKSTTKSTTKGTATKSPYSILARKRTVRCAICLESFQDDQTVRAACPQKHSYCGDCMKQLFLGACKDEELFPPRCCKQEIPIDIALPFLSNEEVEEFLDKTEEFTSKDRTYCFQPSCSKFILAHRISCGVGFCPDCFSETCTLCKKGRHSGDCPDDPSMKLTLETAAENGWQRCQKCHAIVELAHGCQHMTCRLAAPVDN